MLDVPVKLCHLQRAADKGICVVSREEKATYWLTDIMNENSNRFTQLPIAIAGARFSHVCVTVTASTEFQVESGHSLKPAKRVRTAA